MVMMIVTMTVVVQLIMGVVGDDNGNDCGVDGELERKKMCIIMMVVILTETK